MDRSLLTAWSTGGSANRAIEAAKAEDVFERIWRKDASLWKSDEESQELIRNSLGWLTVADEMIGRGG